MANKRAPVLLDSVTVYCDSSWEVETNFEATGPLTYSVQGYLDGVPQRKGSRSRVRRALTWREVARQAAKVQSMWLWGDFRCQISINEVEPWQRDVIVASMIRDGKWHMPALGQFLQRFPDEDLAALYEEYGGLVTDIAIEELNGLREVVEGQSIRTRTLRGLSRLAGTGPRVTLLELACGLATRRHLQAAARVLADGAPEDCCTPEFFAPFSDHSPDLTADQRAGLLVFWMRCEPKPVTEVLGWTDESPILEWLLRHEATAVFAALRDRYGTELEAFCDWLLRTAKPHVAFFTRPVLGWEENTSGRARHGRWADAAKIVDDAARQAGIPIPPDLCVAAMPHREEKATGVAPAAAVPGNSTIPMCGAQFEVTRAENDGKLVSVAFETDSGERVEAVYQMFVWLKPSAAALEYFYLAQRRTPRLVLYPAIDSKDKER